MSKKSSFYWVLNHTFLSQNGDMGHIFGLTDFAKLLKTLHFPLVQNLFVNTAVVFYTGCPIDVVKQENLTFWGSIKIPVN